MSLVAQPAESQLRRPWRRIFEGDELQRMRAVVHELGLALTATIQAASDRGEEIPRGGIEGDLAAREAGIAPCLAYVSVALQRPDYEEASLTALSMAEQRVESSISEPSLFSGFPGLAWALAEVKRTIEPGVEIDDGTFEEIDQALLGYLRRRPSVAPYELIYGLAGIGSYALSRPTSASALACAESVIACLEDTAESSTYGIAWRSGPTERSYHLGMAHGQAGVIAFLAKALDLGVLCDRVRALLSGSANFLVNHQQTGANGAFARTVVLGDPRGEVDVSWCWGDAGTAIALLRGARALGVTEWETLALEVARALIARAGRSPGRVGDASLCHGSAGLGHIFNRFYQATDDAAFADAARDWFRHAVQRRSRQKGIGGFQFRFADEATGQTRWHDCSGYLIGSAGVAAALAAACCDHAPSWDQPLLLS